MTGDQQGGRPYRLDVQMAVQKELLRITTCQTLCVIGPLKASPCDAPEFRPVEAITDHDVHAMKGHLLPEVWTMVSLRQACENAVAIRFEAVSAASGVRSGY